MEDQEIISKYYNEAVKHLSEEMLEDKDIWYSYILNLPEPLQVTYTLGLFNNQVLNGGLHQYFFNPYGQFAFLTVDNLKLIKAVSTAAVLEKAIELVNAEGLSENVFREKIFERALSVISDFDDEVGDALDVLDSDCYEISDETERLLAEYLRTRI